MNDFIRDYSDGPPLTKEEVLKWKGTMIAVDIDKTITKDSLKNWQENKISENIDEFIKLKPDKEMIKFINKLSKHNLVYGFTSRSDLYQDVTNKWLKKHKVGFTYFTCGKPSFDLLIDDKVENVRAFK